MGIEQPDILWSTVVIAGQTLRIGRPNYAKPGMRERIAREALEAELIARPISGLLYFAELERLNRSEHGI